MKKILLLLTLALFVGACGGEKDSPAPAPEPTPAPEPPYDGDDDLWLWDFYNPIVRLWVVDAEGNNLLDAEVEDNLLDRPIEAKYKGKTYPMNGGPEGQTRLNLEYWAGLRVGPYTDHPSGDHSPVLMFGEFAGHTNYNGELFTIDWGDGTTTEVKFDHIVEWVEWTPEFDDWTQEQHPDKVPVVTDKLWIDGELVSDDYLLTARIVK